MWRNRRRIQIETEKVDFKNTWKWIREIGQWNENWWQHYLWDTITKKKLEEEIVKIDECKYIIMNINMKKAI